MIGNSWGNSIVNNCINIGDVSGYDAGGIVGYGDGETITVKNCYNGGNVTGNENVFAIANYYSYDDDAMLQNSFYLQTDNVNAGLKSSNLKKGKDSSEAVTEAEVTSGYVAYSLRSGQAEDETVFWGQTLSGDNADDYPVLGGETVYRNETYEGCVGNPGNPTYSYSNIQEENIYAPHDYVISEDGSYHECTFCHEQEQHSDVVKYSVNETEHSITASCDMCGNLGKITLSAPTGDLTYTGRPKAAMVSGSIKGIALPLVTYKSADGLTDLGMIAPAEVGTYIASISFTDADGIKTVSVEYTIKPATPAPTATPTVAPTATPGVTVTPAPTATPGATATSAPTATPGATATPELTSAPGATTQESPVDGAIVPDDKGAAKYIISDIAAKEVTYKEPVNKKAKTVTIPATVKIKGVTYKVTGIAGNAIKGNNRVTKVTVGSNVRSIGKNAFSGCKKLKTIIIKSKKLTSKAVGKNAFKGVTKVTTIKVPKNKLKSYKKIFNSKGLSSKVKVKG